MKPMNEYLALGEGAADRAFALDVQADGLRGDALRAAAAEFRQAKAIRRYRSKIVSFIKTRGECSQTELFKGINSRRIGQAAVERVIGELMTSGQVYPKQGPSGSKGGRRGVILVWYDKPEQAVMPGAILEEVASNPASQELVSCNPPLIIGGVELKIKKKELDNEFTPCEDAQVAEFRNTLKHEPAPAVEAQKTRRSALLEGLGS